MKKTVSVLLCLMTLFALCACGAESERPNAGTTRTVEDVLNNGMSSSAPEPDLPESGSAPEPSSDPPSDSRYKEYDIDLTKLSSTMVYSEVYNMMTEPEGYLGKVVKVKGPFAVYEGESRNYYACIIEDATACCAQGMEFIPADELVYPEDFPPLETQLTVVGVFDTYKEGDNVYCQLLNAELSYWKESPAE